MINEISANSRVSFKQVTQSGDVFYTFEYGEKRSIDETKYEEEKNKLWNDVNSEINKQIVEVKNLYKRT